VNEQDPVLPRFVALPPAPAGTIAGDFHAGSPVAGSLLHRAGPDGEVAAGRRSSLSEAAFTPTTARAASKLPGILSGEGILVSTGQQPGLFLGPLYTLYKVLSAVAEAERIEAATGRPALASFWIAADDHDWEEVGTASIVDRGGTVRRMSLQPTDSEARRAVGASRLADRVLPLCDEFLDAAGASEFAPAADRMLRSSYTPPARVAEAFRDGFAELLGIVDAVLFDPTHVEVREASRPLLSKLLTDPALVERSFDTGAAEVAAAGYEPRLHRPDGGALLFFDDGRSRSHLLRSGEGYRNGRDGEWKSRREWRSLLESEPSRFSPAAATRPILESSLLPVGRTVLGPGELAYWAQLGPLFRALETELPQTNARQSWLILEPKVERWLQGLDADPLELADGGTAAERRITSHHRPPEVERGLGDTRATINEKLGTLQGIMRAELPGLEASFGKTRKRLAVAMDELEAAVDARVRESRQVSIQRVRRSAGLLYPEGKRQERVDSVFAFLVRYGPSFVESLVAAHGIGRNTA
jgi:bacillithiol biosynthesis cysteine-adding enzyme BshC